MGLFLRGFISSSLLIPLLHFQTSSSPILTLLPSFLAGEADKLCWHPSPSGKQGIFKILHPAKPFHPYFVSSLSYPLLFFSKLPPPLLLFPPSLMLDVRESWISDHTSTHKVLPTWLLPVWFSFQKRFI